jgi:site-specific recombinase XerD
MYPDHDVTTLTHTELARVITSFPPKSRRVRKAAYDSFYRWAMRTERIEKNPMILLPDIRRGPQKVIDVFSDTEIDDLMSLPQIDATLMALLVEGGLRKSEASNLQVRRLRLDDPPSIVVLAGKGGKDRLVPMNARLQQAVNELLLMEHLEPEDSSGARARAEDACNALGRSARAASPSGGALASTRRAFAIETPTPRGTHSRRGGCGAAVDWKR